MMEADLNQNTDEAPRAVTPHVNNVAYNAPNTGSRDEKNSIIGSIFVYCLFYLSAKITISFYNG